LKIKNWLHTNPRYFVKEFIHVPIKNLNQIFRSMCNLPPPIDLKRMKNTYALIPIIFKLPMVDNTGNVGLHLFIKNLRYLQFFIRKREHSKSQ